MVGKGALSEHFLQGMMRECFLLEDKSLQLFDVFASLDDECFSFELALLVEAVDLCVDFALSVL